VKSPLSDIIEYRISEDHLWDGRYKIPWDEPGFSARMLREHLSQEHDMASRKAEMIAAQAGWIHEHLAGGVPRRVLDMGCGPGLYLERFLERGYDCTGIDFSPASIEYAANRLSGEARLVQADLREAEFGGSYDLAIMLFGELNVFSPDDCTRILSKAHDALAPGGVLALEVHTFEVVKRSGLAPDGWYRSDGAGRNLFSDEPHLCLMENHWFDSSRTAVTLFHIASTETGRVETYRNTVRAWTNEDYRRLLKTAGFGQVTERPDWPSPGNDFQFFSAVKDG
jgi:SAM-dependent methyltransferase